MQVTAYFLCNILFDKIFFKRKILLLSTNYEQYLNFKLGIDFLGFIC